MKLSNFPSVRFGQREDFTPIGALRAILRYMGRDVPYHTLMAISGAAFRHAWVPNTYSPSAPLASAEPIISHAIAAMGLQAQRIDIAGAEAGWTMITTALATGHAVLFWGGQRWRAAGVLFGFDESPGQLWARTYTDKDAEGRQIPYASWQQLAAEGVDVWAFGPGGTNPAPDTFGVLQMAVRLLHAEGDGTHQFGLAAYESWARTVEASPPTPDSEAAMLCIALTRTLIDARRAAGQWLVSLPKPLPSSLLTAGDCFTDLQYLLEELAMGLRGREGQAPRDWLARQVRAAGQEDARAASAISATISIVAL